MNLIDSHGKNVIFIDKHEDTYELVDFMVIGKNARTNA